MSSQQHISLTLDQFERLLKAVQPPKISNPNYHSFGDPGPLGLAGFALTTFVLSCFNTGVLIDKALEPVVLPLALFYGGLVQLLAGMWEIRTKNTFGAVAFASYGGFWLSFAGYVYLIVPGLVTKGVAVYRATGIFLLAWTIFSCYMMVASFRVSKILSAIFITLVPALILLTVGAFAQNEGCTNAGGWIGLGCAFLAWYASAAGVINTTWGRTVLPVGHFIARKKEDPPAAAYSPRPAPGGGAPPKAVEV